MDVRAYVGVTDDSWYQHLAARGATEVNFWQPGGGRRFGAVPAGSPFLFKTHAREGNRIVGGGFLSGWASLSVAQAWDLFGSDNGCDSLDDLRLRIGRYRREPAGVDLHHEIGCVMLRDVRFVDPRASYPAPPGWAPNIVQGRSYELATGEGTYVEEVFASIVAGTQGADELATARVVPGPVLRGERRVPTRVGQRAFKALVQEAYGRRCAITGDRILPVLQAGHIRPVAEQGENRVDNGLLLRSDVHILFDEGYLGIHPERRSLMVSRRLRSEFGNGEEFYRRQGESLRLPSRRVEQPHREFLVWHADSKFQD